MSLIRIRPGVQFRPDAAASFRRVEAEAGRLLDVNRTVVSYDEQATLYARRLRGQYPYPVAHPRYSNHVYRDDDDGGNAWDTDERGDWLDEHGWIADVPGEPWHREYRPGRDRHRFDPTPTTEPADQPEEEEDEMDYRPTVHGRLTSDGKKEDEWMLAHPSIGVDLPIFDGTVTEKNSRLSADKSVKTFRGFMVTVNRDTANAWARTYAKGAGNLTSSTKRDDYVRIQKEVSRVAGEFVGAAR